MNTYNGLVDQLLLQGKHPLEMQGRGPGGMLQAFCLIISLISLSFLSIKINIIVKF